MAYSNVGIANMMLQRIGAKSRLTSLTDGSPNAVVVSTVWDYILDEVIEAVKPKFATVRAPLTQGTTDPANTDMYLYEYPLPSDYLCLADDTKDDPAIWPQPGVDPYVIEAMSDGTMSLMTNYDSTGAQAIYMTYVRRVTDPAKFTPSFINAFAFRGAAELTFSIAPGMGKFEAMMNLYGKALLKAKGGSRAQDYLEDEKGSDTWEAAGR
jgi:hypothetical protein